jgi:hypothetical protein
MSNNLGNVVGLIKGPTAPTKKYLLWAKETDSNNPNVVSLLKYNFLTNSWQPIEGLALVSGQTTGTGAAYVLANNPAINAYAAYQQFTVTFHASNTVVAPTINVDGKGAEVLVNATGAALEVGEIKAGQRCIISRVASKWRVIGGGSGSGSSGGAIPTISLTYPSGNPTTNVSLSQYFEFTFVSSNPILVGSTSGTALANGASANLNSLLTVRKAGIPITTYSATYNLTQKKIIIDIVPNGFMDDNTDYEIVIDGAYNISGACASLTYSFTTLTQQILLGISKFDTGNVLIPPSEAANNRSKNNVYDTVYCAKIDALVTGSYNDTKLSIFDKDDFTIDYASDYETSISNINGLAWDDLNQFLFFRNSSNTNIYCYNITKNVNTFTVVAKNATSTGLNSTFGLISVFQANGISYLCDVVGDGINISLYFYAIDPSNGSLTEVVSKRKINFDSAANLTGYYGTDVDIKANQLVFGNNFKRLDLSLDTSQVLPSLTPISGYTNSAIPTAWRTSYNLDNQLILIGIGNSIKAIKANISTNTYINFDTKTLNTLRDYIDLGTLDIPKPILIGNRLIISTRYKCLGFNVTF